MTSCPSIPEVKAMSKSTKTQAPGKDPGCRKPARRKTLIALSRSADREAKRLVVVILEVLGGVRTPSEAAEVLGVSLTRYYALETKALAGLLEACKKRPVGPQRSPEREIARLEREIERLESECARSQALFRVAQRSVGLPAPERGKKAGVGGKKRPKRKPTARALRLVEIFQDAEKALDTRTPSIENGKEVKKAES
jgi:hypothetical protein